MSEPAQWHRPRVVRLHRRIIKALYWALDEAAKEEDDLVTSAMFSGKASAYHEMAQQIEVIFGLVRLTREESNEPNIP